MPDFADDEFFGGSFGDFLLMARVIAKYPNAQHYPMTIQRALLLNEKIQAI